MIYGASGSELSKPYAVTGQEINAAYNISGDQVFPESGIAKYENYTIAPMAWTAYSGLQDIAYHDGKLVMVTGNNELSICDAETGVRLPQGGSPISVEIGHGNTLCFADDYYDSADMFPLLCTSYNGVSYYRIANSMESAQTVSNYKLQPTPVSTLVWYGIGINGRWLYAIGYNDGSYQESFTNRITVAKYDRETLIDNGDGTYSYALVHRVTRDWFECIQGCDYHDGFLWVQSGFTNPSHVYAININTGEIMLDIPLAEYTTYEAEGITWKNDYTLIVGLRQAGSNKGMFEITFPDLIPSNE